MLDPNGKASRSEFWAVNLAVLVVQAIALAALAIYVGFAMQEAGINTTYAKGSVEHGKASLELLSEYKFAFLTIMILPLVPQVIVAQRRMNDRGGAQKRAFAFFIPTAILWKTAVFTGVLPAIAVVTYLWPVWLAFAAWYFIELGCWPSAGAASATVVPSVATPREVRAVAAALPAARTPSAHPLAAPRRPARQLRGGFGRRASV